MNLRAATAWVSATERRFYHVPARERISVEERFSAQDHVGQGTVADPRLDKASQNVRGTGAWP